MRARTAILSILVAALSGCTGFDSVPDSALESCDQSQVLPARVKTDILFVVDDSSSMDPYQERVRNALSRFIGTLAGSPIQNDFQIGVTNTSVEDYVYYVGTTPILNKFYRTGPSVGVPYPAGALVAVDPTNLVYGSPSTYGDFYYTWNTSAPNPGFYGPPSNPLTQIMTWDAANLTTDFKNDVLVGTNGSGREQLFRAVQLALTTQIGAAGENVGFLRPGARLAIIFLTDEDDCSGPMDPNISTDTQCRAARTDPSSSLLPVSQFGSFLQGPLGGETRDVVLAAITGVTCSGGVCTDTPCSTSVFTTPDRVLSLLSMFSPARTRLASICDGTFDQALDDFATAIMSQTLPLDGAVADYRMLVVTVTRPGVGTIGCTVGDASSTTADVIYESPQGGRPASLTFQNACALQQGDQVSVKIVCAR